MDKRGMINIEVKKEDHTYTFSMPIGCPLGEAYDSIVEISQEVSAMFNEKIEQIKKHQEENKEKNSAKEKEIELVDEKDTDSK